MAQVLFKAASLLGLRVSEFVYTPFKSRVLVSYRTLALPDLSRTDFQSPWN